MVKKSSRRKRTYTIFISHSTKDKWIARQISRLLEEAGTQIGTRTFLDAKDIEYGASIPDTIRRALQDCDEFLVLLSRYSIDRPWVLLETGGA